MTVDVADRCPGCRGPAVALAGRQVEEGGPVMLWWSCGACGWSTAPARLPDSLTPEEWRTAPAIDGQLYLVGDPGDEHPS